MFPPDLLSDAAALLDRLRAQGLRLATAESCTGGLIAALFTEIAGSSDVVERGFVTYSNAAKTELLGVSDELLARHGAVSEPVARAMVQGALAHSHADVAVSVTGVAGPGGGSDAKPVGLVHIAAMRKGGDDPASGMPLRRHRPRADPSRQRRGRASADLACGRRFRAVDRARALLEGERVAAERAVEQGADQHLQHHRLELVGDEEIDIASARRRAELPAVLQLPEGSARVFRALRLHRELRRDRT